MNKTAFVISIALTTFVLFAVVGIVYAVRATDQPQVAQAAAPSAVPADPTSEASPTASTDQTLVQTLSEREAAYQDLIAQANARLQQMEQQQQALQDQLAASQADSQSPITPDQAATAAASYLGHTDVYAISQVLLDGQMVYQVSFNSGETVYVDLTGQVVGYIPASTVTLNNPSANQPANQSANQPTYHEQDDDDDDDD
jgi:hypothetical protein